MKTDDIRSAYLGFFRSKVHEVVPSDSLVPTDDPSLLFTGAGMNQFKEKFLGKNITYKRATSCQKCLRTGDLENVGRTAGHHTFFEMLGNFSFGDYFKKEAIEWAWEFLTITLKIKPDRLWVSVYNDDNEAYGIWKDIVKVPQNRIVRLGEKDNYWPSEAPSKGPNGPCGPCSEIFFDLGEGAGCGKKDCSPACDCRRFIEIWNLVFTQFDRQQDGTLKPLPSKNIDTGMGLERISAVMQNVRTNFETDSFVPIVNEIMDASHSSKKKDTAKMNAIADHMRAVVFCISDGVMPSNEDRGYVVRKLIRRSSKYAHDLGIKWQFLYKLVTVVTDVMGRAYPCLKERRDEIAGIVKREEENFAFVIDTQLPKVEEAFGKMAKDVSGSALAGVAFNFYDTYGMPYEMLEELAEKYSLKIDKNEFDRLLEKQREQSRSKSKIKSEIFSETFAKKVEALNLKTEFLGYEDSKAEAVVLEVMGGGEVILDRTPFYGESGGQAGDWGIIETPSGRMEVEDAKRIGHTIVHIGRTLKGRIVKGERARVSIDEEVRKKVMCNHTATHLLQAALRKVLGEHVRQMGSSVGEDRLRFDFTHMQKMDERQIVRVEEIVNDNIARSIPVTKSIMDINEAKAGGATALFNEKYDSTVRVVTIGDVSKELCGGTHVNNSAEIVFFKIVAESSIASGTRRIEALTGEAAKKWVVEQKIKEKEKLAQQEKKDGQKKALEDNIRTHMGNIDAIAALARKIAGISVVAERVADGNAELLRRLADGLKDKGIDIAVLASASEEKVSFVVYVKSAIAQSGKANANEIAKDIAKMLGGSGGGRPDFAQGGGKDISLLDGVLAGAIGIIEGRIK